MTKAGIDLIKKWEGFSATAYLCPAKVWTIGYGFTKGVRPGDIIDEAEAEKRLTQELKYYENAVLDCLFVDPNANQLAAMTSLCYNIGPGNFKSSSVQRFHNMQNFEDAARSFLLWNKAGGQVLQGLTNRRQEEMKLYKAPV